VNIPPINSFSISKFILRHNFLSQNIQVDVNEGEISPSEKAYFSSSKFHHSTIPKILPPQGPTDISYKLPSGSPTIGTDRGAFFPGREETFSSICLSLPWSGDPEYVFAVCTSLAVRGDHRTARTPSSFIQHITGELPPLWDPSTFPFPPCGGIHHTCRMGFLLGERNQNLFTLYFLPFVRQPCQRRQIINLINVIWLHIMQYILANQEKYLKNVDFFCMLMHS